MAVIKCYLKCALGTHEDIELLDKTSTAIGRSTKTQIADTRCSKKQVEFTADYKTRTVHVKNVGFNSAGINGKVLKKNEEYVLNDGDEIELLFGCFRHVLEFVKSPATKRKQLFDEDVKDKKDKRIKTDNSTSDADDSEEEKRVARIAADLKILKQGSQSARRDVKKSLNSSNERNISFKESVKHENKMDETPRIGNSDDEPLVTDTWKVLDSLLIFTSAKAVPKDKIAAFDLDWTLIRTISGRVFPKDINDWKLHNDFVKRKLKKLHDSNFKIVIFSNQKAIGTGRTKISDFQAKLEAIVKDLNVPLQAIISFKNDIYRKPAPGMWNYLCEKANGGLEICLQESFYVGDAAGREARPPEKKDFSASDRLFAWNIDISFKTPEEFFLNVSAQKFKNPDFDPRAVSFNTPIASPSTSSITSTGLEVIVLVGLPASGKSFFSKTHMMPAGYKIANRDTLGTWQKCVAFCKNALTNGNSVVIDNTNPDKASRKRFIDCARESSVPCRCFQFTATIDHCKHNNKFRALTNDGKTQIISDMVMNSIRSKFEAPSMAEGFTEILNINFLPKFTSPKMEKLYKMFLV